MTKYYQDGELIWDDAIDGEFPPEMVQHRGYLKRVLNRLEIDPIKKAVFDARALEEAQISQARGAALAVIKTPIRSIPDAEEFRKALVTYLIGGA